MPRKFPIAVLISGEGSNLQAILDAIATGMLSAQVSVVISNAPESRGLARAHAAGVPTEVVDHRAYPNRAAFDHALAATIDRYAPALVVLAGFMRILTSDFVNHYLGRMINIHPSLLPAFPGLDTHRRALAAGASMHGASVHFVTCELDGGPVIAQTRVPVQPNDDASTLARRVLAEEHILLPQVIGWLAAGRVHLAPGCAMLDGHAVMLTEES